MNNLQGSWKLISVQTEGKEYPPEYASFSRLTVKNNRFILERGKETQEREISLDPEKSPKEIDLRDIKDDKDVYLGIYSLKDALLLVSYYPIPNKRSQRPTSF